MEPLIFFLSHEGSTNICDEITAARTWIMDPGDVFVIEMQATVSGVNYVPIEYQSYNYDCIVETIGLNYPVVMAAGNGDVNLDTVSVAHNPFIWQNDSGAIIVGAGEPTSHEKTGGGAGVASSYGSRVDVQGWGNSALTTGLSDGFYEFSGTSSGAAMVGGVVALVQSAYKAATGLVAMPQQIRGSLVLTGTAQGSATSSTKVGPLPDAYAAKEMLIATGSMPTNFSAQSAFCFGHGQLQWGPPGSGSYTYQVQASHSPSFTPSGLWFEYIGANQSTLVDIVHDTYFRVRACNANGCGAFSPSQYLIRHSMCH